MPSAGTMPWDTCFSWVGMENIYTQGNGDSIDECWETGELP